MKKLLPFIILFAISSYVLAANCDNRYNITSSCTCNGASVSNGYCCYYNTTNVTYQATDQCGYTQYSPHWGHILTEKLDYRLQYYPANRTAEIQDYAIRYDQMVTNYIDAMKVIDPTQKELQYQLDLSYMRDLDLYGLNSYLPSYATNTSANIEDAYLHFSQDTSLTLNGSTISVPSCTIGTRSPTCRVQTFMWNTYRYIPNPKTTLTKNMFANWWLYVVNNATTGGNILDGVWIDERPLVSTGSAGQSIINSGGGILEYGGSTWNDLAFTNAYYPDIDTFVYAEQSLLPSNKTFWINLAEYYNTALGMEQANVANGTFWELSVSPYLREPTLLWNTTRQLMDRGKSVVYSTKEKYSNPPWDVYPFGDNAGNSKNSSFRSRIVELSIYYLGKDKENKLAYFEILGGWGNQFIYQWTTAQEVDIGTPIANYTLFSTGANYNIYMRNFTKAIVYYRPDNNLGSYDNATAISFNLTGNFTPVDADGSIGLVTSNWSLRNSEAAIMLIVTPTPTITPTPTAIIGGGGGGGGIVPIIHTATPSSSPTSAIVAKIAEENTDNPFSLWVIGGIGIILLSIFFVIIKKGDVNERRRRK